MDHLFCDQCLLRLEEKPVDVCWLTGSTYHDFCLPSLWWWGFHDLVAVLVFVYSVVMHKYKRNTFTSVIVKLRASFLFEKCLFFMRKRVLEVNMQFGAVLPAVKGKFNCSHYEDFHLFLMVLLIISFMFIDLWDHVGTCSLISVDEFWGI